MTHLPFTSERLKPTSGVEVLRRNRSALRDLDERYRQRAQGANASTGQSSLDVAAEALAEYTTLLESDRNEILYGYRPFTFGAPLRTACGAVRCWLRALPTHTAGRRRTQTRGLRKGTIDA